MKYIFYIPAYVSNSNGIKTLWEAAYLFSQTRAVFIHSFDGGASVMHKPPSKYASLIKAYTLEPEDIVIYPDIVEGNPLNANCVCRYMMAKEFILNGRPTQFSERDFILSYSYAVDTQAPQLNILLEDLNDLEQYTPVKKEDLVVVYYGKCRISLGKTEIKRVLRDFKQVAVFTRSTPGTKEELYQKIAKAKLFVSFDPLSSLCYEANLLGTPALLLDDVFRYAFDHFNHELPGFYYHYNDLKNMNLIELGLKIQTLARADLAKKIQGNLAKTEKIIAQIETFFSAKKIDSDKIPREKRNIDFYFDQWKASPIINCASLESVICYGLMRKNIFLYLFIRIPLFMISNLRLFGQSGHRSRFSYFTDAEEKSIQYLLNRKKFLKTTKESLEAFSNEHSTSSTSSQNLDNSGRKFKIWRLLCM